MILDEGNYQPTSLDAIASHFVCKLCLNMVFDAKQCCNKSCEILFCAPCIAKKRTKSSWSCPNCGERQAPVDVNRKLRQFMELLKIVCPGCKEGFMYTQIVDHIEKCDEALKLKNRERPTGGGNKEEQKAAIAEAQYQRRQTQMNKF